MKKTILIILSFVLIKTSFSQQAILLADANPGSGDGIFINLSGLHYDILNDVYYYMASDSVHGLELWRTDGTPTGTYMVKDIAPGPENSWPSNIYTIGNQIFFSATTLAEGNELWVSDGTPAGTHITKDIFPGSGDGLFTYVLKFWEKNNLFYFIARDTIGNNNIWYSDGTLNGTLLLKDINTNFNITNYPTEAREFNNQLLFAATDSAHWEELWITDGTPANTYMLADLNPVMSSGPVLNGNSAFEYNGILYFKANLSHGANNELFRTDGTSAGTRLVKDVNPTGSSDIFIGTNFIINNDVIFKARVDSLGEELFKMDLITENISLVKESFPGLSSSIGAGVWNLFPQVNSSIGYYLGNDSTHGTELWRTDGTPAGTYMVKDIYPGTSHGVLQIPGGLTWFNNKFIFSGEDPVHGSEIWATDGTTSGTELLSDCYPGIGDGFGYFTLLKEYNGNLYFSANEENNIDELFISDGTPASTHNLEINPGNSSRCNPYDVDEVNGIWYFSATVDSCGSELFKLDGNTFSLYQDLVPGPNGFNPGALPGFSDLFTFNDGQDLYLIADSSQNHLHPEIWRTDHATGQMVLCSNFNCGETTSHISKPVILGHRYVVFYVKTDSLGYEMWSIEVPNASTVSIKESIKSKIKIYPNPSSEFVNIEIPAELKDVIVFLYDVNGQLIREIEFSQPGTKQISLDGIQSGFYFYQIKSELINQTGKLIVVKY